MREDPRDASPLSRPGIASVGDDAGILPITDRRLLLPSSRTRCFLGEPHGSLSLPRGVWGRESNGVTSFNARIGGG